MDQDKPRRRPIAGCRRRPPRAGGDRGTRRHAAATSRFQFPSFRRWCGMPRSDGRLWADGSSRCSAFAKSRRGETGASISFQLIARGRPLDAVEARQLRRMAGASKQQATPSAPSVTAARRWLTNHKARIARLCISRTGRVWLFGHCRRLRAASFKLSKLPHGGVAFWRCRKPRSRCGCGGPTVRRPMASGRRRCSVSFPSSKAAVPGRAVILLSDGWRSTFPRARQ